MPARAQAPHRAATTAPLPPHCYPRTATPAPRNGSTPALLPPRLCPRTSAPALAQARRSPSILLPGLAHPLRGRAERSVHAWGCSRTSPHAQALQYYCQAWLTHCVGEPNAPSMPGDAHARHRLRHAWVCMGMLPTQKPFNTTARPGSPTAWASRTLRPCLGMLTHVTGFGSRRRVGMSGYTRIFTSTSRGSGSRPEPYTPMLGCACASVGLPPIYTTVHDVCSGRR